VIAVQSSEPSLVVPTRRMSFDVALTDLPHHFAEHGDLISSHATAVSSAIFPHGEEFFVRSVRHFRDRIIDPALRRQVAGFIGQESMHGREHAVLNERLAELGYPTRKLARWTDRLFRSLERRVSPEVNLALTAAFEHMTAMLAEWMMDDEEFRDSMGHPAIRGIFLWHCLEESEHKAVAFDVYRAVGGSEALRVRTMKVLQVAFTVTTVAFTVVSLAGDRDTYRPRILWRSVREYASSPLVSKEYRRRLSEYERHGFHPNDRDTTALVKRWTEELFGAGGELTHVLVSEGASTRTP